MNLQENNKDFMSDSALYGVVRLSNKFGLSPATVRRWIDRGWFGDTEPVGRNYVFTKEQAEKARRKYLEYLRRVIADHEEIISRVESVNL